MRHTKWTNKIALDLALVLESQLGTVQDLLESNRITDRDLAEFSQDKQFLNTVEGYREEIRDKGLAFRLKARVQAEELLRTSYLLTQDPDVPASVKADLIKSTVKWAGYEVAPTAAPTTGGGVSIQINFRNPEGAAPEVVNITPNRQAVPFEEE